MSEEEREAKEIAPSFSIEKEREMGFLLLGALFGVVLGIVGNLWVAFFIELIRNLISPELWMVASSLGLIIATILLFFILKVMFRTIELYTRFTEFLEKDIAKAKDQSKMGETT